jgi:threonine synthase
MIKTGVYCTICSRAYPPNGVPYRCPVCDGVYDFFGEFHFDPEQVEPKQPGIWRYRHAFGLPPDLNPVSLGEGNTPLVWAKVFDRQVAFKCEFNNPSGSFKDRGSAVITAWLKYRGVTEVVEDSSGNAGASLAAYAARAGIKVRIFIPNSASGPKKRQIEVYGAELVSVSGSRSDVAEAVRKSAVAGSVYASHAFLPFNLPGYATSAYEIVEQVGQMPGSVIVPAGQGGLLLGLTRGFVALRIDKSRMEIPRMVGVQASACAPLWKLFTTDGKEPALFEDLGTLAEGVKVRNPIRKDAVISAMKASYGSICTTDENAILPGRDALASLGFYVEPTSAIVWGALEKMVEKLPDPIVVILTGSGLKYG